MSLDDVEERSGGRWSSSAVGAYERGYRTLTVERLRSLAEFYGVPISVLLAPTPKRDDDIRGRVVIDLEALGRAGSELAPVLRMARSIQIQRGDFNGKVLSIRQSDVKNLSLLYGITFDEMMGKLDSHSVILSVEDSFEGPEDELNGSAEED